MAPSEKEEHIIFTKKERLILANQFRVLEHLDPNEAEFYRNAHRVLVSGYELEYESIFGWLGDPFTRDECLEVVEVLEMFSRLSYAYRKLADTEGIDAARLRFRGFDGNNEAAHMGYAEFLIKEHGKWAQFRSMDLNSHAPTLDRYRRMLREWKKLPIDKLELSKDEIRGIIEA